MYADKRFVIEQDNKGFLWVHVQEPFGVGSYSSGYKIRYFFSWDRHFTIWERHDLIYRPEKDFVKKRIKDQWIKASCSLIGEFC